MNKRDKLLILKELQQRLNGICSTQNSCCPQVISQGTWGCIHCADMFDDICTLKTYNDGGFLVFECPCIVAREDPERLPPDMILTRLNKYIEKLKKKHLTVASIFDNLFLEK